MALLDDTSEARTERPTERHRQQARERGMVARSAELLTAARLVAIWIVLVWWFAKFVNSATSSLRAALENAGPTTLQPSTALAQLRDFAWQFLELASWPLLTATAVLLLAHFGQVGWLWNWENAAPQLARLSPFTGIQRLLAWTTIGRALGLTLKLAVVACASSVALSLILPLSPPSLSAEMTDPFATMGPNAVQLAAHVALAVLAYAALDYVWQRWRFEHSLLMTREELREELKEIEGDPRLKSRRQETTLRFNPESTPPHSSTSHPL